MNSSSYHLEAGNTCYLVMHGERPALVRHLRDPDPIPIDCRNVPEADRLLCNNPGKVLPTGLGLERTGALLTTGRMYMRPDVTDSGVVLVLSKKGLHAIHYTVIELPEHVM